MPPPRYLHESPEEGQAGKKRRRGDGVQSFSPNTAVWLWPSNMSKPPPSVTDTSESR